ncbi:hypothetical protein EAG_14481 [Camponotus floridanus]|uniref:Uncharacterized protein n=1 Tax=Camponotus floridanus TaxID=104421 RepID=E2APT7_CAMFO|nr:hypothetical protein EAG_14481 [Camponotus floridanus]
MAVADLVRSSTSAMASPIISISTKTMIPWPFRQNRGKDKTSRAENNPRFRAESQLLRARMVQEECPTHQTLCYNAL